jgi:segregation and condensation protein A
MPEAFKIKTDIFEGPLDLLLDLVESRKLLISDISLASVCDEYISRVEAMGEMPLQESADFVALAATLLLIKSRSLLPSLSLSDEETHDIKELEYRLAVYQIIREAARGLEKSFGKMPLYEGMPVEPEPLYLPDAKVTLESLLTAARRLIEEFPGKSPLLPEAVVRKIISLEEMIEELGTRITSAIKLSFREYAGFGKKEKTDIIVTFLALLELVKQGMIRAEQEHAFEDITLEHEGVGRPSYE